MKLQDKLVIFGRWSCLAQCYIYKALWDKAEEVERTNKDFMESCINAVLLAAFSDKTILDDECTVLNPVKLMKMTSGLNYNVTKKDISSVKELPVDGWAAVRFDYNGNGHWVLFHGHTMVYNSLEDSKCFSYGKPTTARIIEKQL